MLYPGIYSLQPKSNRIDETNKSKPERVEAYNTIIMAVELNVLDSAKLYKKAIHVYK